MTVDIDPAEMLRFITSVADLKRDGDIDAGEIVELENDDIFSALYAVIGEARELLGRTEVSED